MMINANKKNEILFRYRSLVFQLSFSVYRITAKDNSIKLYAIKSIGLFQIRSFVKKSLTLLKYLLDLQILQLIRPSIKKEKTR